MTPTAIHEVRRELDMAATAAAAGDAERVRLHLDLARSWLPKERKRLRTVAEERRTALLVPCSTCRARPGEDCIRDGLPTSVLHATRIADGAP
jgi:hypothetical protein